MASSHCHRMAKDGVMDMTYIERRLDEIESRLDDLCGLLGSVLEAVGLDSVDDSTRPIESYHGDDCTCGRHLRVIRPDDGS